MFKKIKKARCVLCGDVKEISETIEGNAVCSSCSDKIPCPCPGCMHDGFCKYQSDGSDPMYCFIVLETALEYIKKNIVA